MLPDELIQGLGEVVPVQGMLGYLNFSEGRPDPRFQKQVDDAVAYLAGRFVPQPWEALGQALAWHLERLKAEGGAAFRDATQAEAVIRLAFGPVLTAYRDFHADLLFHQSDAELFQPFFLARVCEAVLAQRGPWDETERITLGAVRRLNDYVGHRPVAVLEGERRGEVHDHERVRPIPLYLRGAGVAHGRYRAILDKALAILEATDPGLLAEAGFDPEQLDEWALDPRGYDFDHPADKRPNYVFGEWDPHLIDNRGRYRRFVGRRITLDGLLHRVETTTDLPTDEVLFEAAAVLAGTVLMAAGVRGGGPQAHDSSVTLTTLVQRIARYREAFYDRLLQTVAGPHGDRLREEARVTRQPFGLARRALNHYLARRRALQLQQRHLALLFADLGYPAASRRQLAALPVASARILTEITIGLTTAHARADHGRLDEAAGDVARIEDLLRRGIACGALADPWNVLGFQGQFPRFPALEDSIRDTRVDALVHVVGRLFGLYALVLAEQAAQGVRGPGERLARDMRRLAEWWDAFATTTVSDIPHVHGGDAVQSAEHVARALGLWHDRGRAAADLKLWRDEAENFRTPKAFALVVDALLDRRDHEAAMALLVVWVGQAEEVPLAAGEHSFHPLAVRWLLGVQADADPATAARLTRRFFDLLEANAETYWQVPRLDVLGTGDESPGKEPGDDEDDVYGAAYEGVTYKDTTDDDVESEVLDIMPQKDFDLTHEAERIEPRLRFLATVARLWNIASRVVAGAPAEQRGALQEAAAGWVEQARRNYAGLLRLLDRVHEHEVPRPTGNFDSMVEYDRRNLTKEQLLGGILGTALDEALAIGALRGVLDADTPAGHGAAWEPAALDLERALLRRDVARARKLLPEFMRRFRGEPLLYTPLAQGGDPRAILRATLAQMVLRALVHSLPRQGMLRETYQLVRLARAMEAGQDLPGPRITEFDRVYQLAVQAVADAVVAAARRDGVEPAKAVDALQEVVEPFLAVWMDHSQTLRVSALEQIASDRDWLKLKDFIKRFGRDLFSARFLALGNLRGILHRGIGPWLDYLAENPDPLRPVKLIDELGRTIPRPDAEAHLRLILQALIENYDHLRDFNATTAQSDYGDNLYQLLDFLRLKAGYDRIAWRLRPLALVHEVLARHDGAMAALWRAKAEHVTREPAAKQLERLARLEREYGVRLATVTDRLEERFVRPMELDRLCALIPPALAYARANIGTADDRCPLEDELRPFTSTPAGVGMDVPPWLARLEAEVHRARNTQSAVANIAESTFQVPSVDATFAELAEQLKDWRQLALEGE
jgi:hypothetical protein